MRSSSRGSRFVLACIALVLFSVAATAEVVRIEVRSRAPFAEGRIFGPVGPYELVKGRLHFAVDPEHPANARIVDLSLAPRDPQGRVRFHADFELLKPVDFAKGNRRLLYDVTNHGNKVVLGQLNEAGGNQPHPGNGFLMREGYSILWSGWNWDVPAGDGRLQVQLPVARDGVRPIRQRIAVELVLSFDRDIVRSLPVGGPNARGYPAVNIAPDSPAVLTVRDTPRGERQVIPRKRWRWGRRVDDEFEPRRTWITIDGRFEHGRIYELVYEAQNPRVVGLGFAAVRDALSFFHFATEDGTGSSNPLVLIDRSGARRPGIEKAYAWGTSQSGRFLTHMLWQGFHVDEAGRMVFAGAHIHAAGGGKGGFNHRFAQTSQHPSHLEGNGMPADHRPFWFLPDNHPASGTLDDVLARSKELDRLPRLVITANEHDYWTRAASLVHTSLDGTADVPLHRDVRLYVVNGAPHRPSFTRVRGVHEHGLNTFDGSPFLRATVGLLDRWVTQDFAPPVSRYPRLGNGTLLTAADHREAFPSVPGLRHPGVCFAPSRLGLGPRFWTEGIADAVPPVLGESYATLVPAFDADGNGEGGVRLPDLTVPLGTYQGWNPRHRRYGAPDFLGRHDGSFWPLALTEEERLAVGDPRPSLAARYRDHAHYVELVTAASRRLVDTGFLLPFDAQAYVAHAEAIAWPPRPRDDPPFWEKP